MRERAVLAVFAHVTLGREEIPTHVFREFLRLLYSGGGGLLLLLLLFSFILAEAGVVLSVQKMTLTAVIAPSPLGPVDAQLLRAHTGRRS